jgi:hypothetical protein
MSAWCPLTWEDAMAIEKVIRTQDAEENTISGRYSIKEGAVIVSAPDGSRLKASAGANAEATAKMLLREWARKKLK